MDSRRQDHRQDRRGETFELASSFLLIRDLTGRSAAIQPKEEQIVLNTIRCLAADLCQQVSISRSAVSKFFDHVVVQAD